MELVFVYGTLKQGFSNHVLLKHSKLVGQGATQNRYAMYRSGIPFVSQKERVSTISGEVYEVNKNTLHNLDILEGHPNWYRRIKTPIDIINKTGDIKTINAWLYFNEEIPEQAELIKSGIYEQNRSSRFFSLLF